MVDDFEQIKSALADIARALQALKMHPERDVAVHLNRIARAAAVIEKHAGEAEHARDLITLAEHRRLYAP
jgi:hypothetical protein